MKTRVRALPRKGTRGVRPHFRSLGADTKRAIFLPRNPSTASIPVYEYDFLSDRKGVRKDRVGELSLSSKQVDDLARRIAAVKRKSGPAWKAYVKEKNRCLGASRTTRRRGQ